MFAALLDTNVLWPTLQRDVLLSFAVEGIYRPLWSSAILDELAFHEARKLRQRAAGSQDAEARAARLIAPMRAAFADSEVAGWEALEGTFGLPDVDDEHIVAAARLGSAGVLVTHNVRDFPAALLPAVLEVQVPSESRITLSPAVGDCTARGPRAVSARTGVSGQSLTVEHVLVSLDERYGFTDAVRLRRQEAGSES